MSLRDPAKIVSFAAKATWPSMPNWRRLYFNTHRAKILVVELVQETAGRARIIDRLVAEYFNDRLIGVRGALGTLVA
jgi:hypothetical protein